LEDLRGYMSSLAIWYFSFQGVDRLIGGIVRDRLNADMLFRMQEMASLQHVVRFFSSSHVPHTHRARLRPGNITDRPVSACVHTRLLYRRITFDGWASMQAPLAVGS
jgi:hypothetical protein